ncbi:KGGVGR-motif variant AAA ATPase [Streptomyces sp. NPDC012935]|uniref:KGGVGR-motif variant AAA ATPase n=1 Tax=Streptomyces sp. NPDC012935 TaxID=3364857 RepID=UPI00369CD88B
MNPTRFDAAWHAALGHAHRAAETGRDTVLVRDLFGRASLLIDDESEPLPAEELESLAEAFRRDTQAFAGPQPVQAASTMFAPEMFFASPELIVEDEGEPGHRGRVAVLERTVVGADWAREAAPGASPQPEVRERRVALYGFKGGVGRSTATAVLARHLADKGHCVLVVDLDLESPGVSTLLHGLDELPEHGIVDHLVEAGVGNADELDLVTQSSFFVPTQGNGEIWLAPAGGRPRDDYDYLAKLNRIYSDLPAAEPGGAPKPFCVRLEEAIAACEAQVAGISRQPDVVLLDSRAGIHDIAAVTLTQLSGLSLLFTVDNPSTWYGYGMLFSQWKQRPDRAVDLRERLRIVAAMFRSAGDIQRLHKLRDNAQKMFAETLYDDAEGGDLDAYHPALEDDQAPHSPIPILFSHDLIGLDPLQDRDWPELPFVEAAYKRFLDEVYQLVFPSEELS